MDSVCNANHKVIFHQDCIICVLNFNIIKYFPLQGYDSMGFEMSKPNLRSEFEADLKL